jgi:hypothetical protein
MDAGYWHLGTEWSRTEKRRIAQVMAAQAELIILILGIKRPTLMIFELHLFVLMIFPGFLHMADNAIMVSWLASNMICEHLRIKTYGRGGIRMHSLLIKMTTNTLSLVTLFISALYSAIYMIICGSAIVDSLSMTSLATVIPGRVSMCVIFGREIVTCHAVQV